MNNLKLLFVVNDPSFFLSHRLPLAEAARNEGFNVQIATMGGPVAEKIKQLGFVHHSIPLSRSGRNPLNELFTFFSLWRLFKKLSPDLVHLVTIKPVLYGGIAARLARVSGVISAISGLGFLFVKRAGFRVRLIRYGVLFLYRLAMNHPNQRVIFQNPTDLNALVIDVGVKKDKVSLIHGSGVNLQDYPMKAEPDGIPTFVMASRLLKDKGVHEFVGAARQLQAKGTKAHFKLIGDTDPENPASVTSESLEAWKKEGIVQCLGFRTDIPEIFSQANVVCLPSYYGEGLPKVLIEAAACGRAVITTDMPGCRDAIEPNISGLLIPARNVDALVEAMEYLVKDDEIRQRMGIAGRALAEHKFGIDKVINKHLTIYNELTSLQNI